MTHQFEGNKGYKKIKHLGEGSFGKVYLVKGTDDDILYVIKECNINKMEEKHINNALTEVKVLKTMNHPNITHFKEVYKTKKGKLCIVMEYADGGDLSMAIDSQNGKHFPEEQILDWFTQICLALRYVHDSKILHRDLKCQNIFLTKGNIIKLGDFGIACILSNTLENAKTMAGTPFNLSPEIIDGKEYSYKSDIWSLGIVLYELCALQPPFMANGFTLLAVKIMKGQFAPIPKHYSKDLQNLISMLLRIDPLQRPSVAEILNLPFIKQRIMEPWGITKNMCLSPHQLEVEKNHSSAQSTCDQSFSQKTPAAELNTSSKFIGIQNPGHSSPKTLHPDMAKRQSQPHPDLITHNLFPPLGPLNNQSLHPDLSSMNNTKQSSFSGEEESIPINHFLPKYRQKSPIEERDDIDWEFMQKAQNTIKKNLENSQIAIQRRDEAKHSKFTTSPRNQNSFDPLHSEHHNKNKNKIFRKIVESDLGPVSPEVSPGRSAITSNMKKTQLKNSDKSANKNLYSVCEEQTIIKRNLSCSPDKKNKNRMKSDQPNQDQEEFVKITDENRKLAVKAIFDPKRGTDKAQARNKINIPGEMKREVHIEIRKKTHEGIKFHKANSTEAEIPIKYPILSQQTPAVDTEPAFLQENVNRDELDNKQRLQRTRVGSTEPEDLDLTPLRPKYVYKVQPSGDRQNKKEFRSVNRIDRNSVGEAKNLPELESPPIKGKFGGDKQTMNYHPEFIRRGDTLHEVKESADFSIRDMNSSYYQKQVGISFIQKPKPSAEQINKSRIIAKGVLAAVNKVMSQFGPNETIHDRYTHAKELASIKESTEIKYQRDRLRYIGSNRNRIADFNKIEDQKNPVKNPHSLLTSFDYTSLLSTDEFLEKISLN